jgi:hypothetical protein
MRGARVYAVLLIGLLAMAVVPGFVEATENAVHLVLHGDLAHSSRPGHLPFDQEHGCAPGCHLCSCCHSPLLEHYGQPALFASRVPTSLFRVPGSLPTAPGYAQAPQQPPRS